MKKNIAGANNTNRSKYDCLSLCFKAIVLVG